ncbi:unnamed protein product, partial [Mesorhabditis spiculigera]
MTEWEDTLRFEMDNQSLVYRPGEFVSGTAILRLTEPCTARVVTIKLRGFAKTRWEYRRSSRRHDHTSYSHTDRYGGDIDIARQEVVVWSDQQSEKIPAGMHQFKFQFQLPPSCLPSFEGEYGQVRYRLHAEVDRPWRFDHDCHLTFTVTTPCDLNLYPELKEPAFHIVCEKTGLPLFRRGDVGVEVYMPKKGFVPGETIPVRITIKNESSKDMEKVTLTLREYADYAGYYGADNQFPVNALFSAAATGDSLKEQRRNVASVDFKLNMAAHAEGSFDFGLQIPPVVASFQCALIRVYYMLRIEVETSATFNSTVKLKMPVVIGTLPFRENFPLPAVNTAGYPNHVIPNPQPTQQPGFVRDAPEFAPQPTTAPTAPPMEYSGPSAPGVDAPPSYAESVFGATAPEGDEKPFAPRFPFYPSLSDDSLKVPPKE